MKLFFALVHQDEGSAYGIQFPDVPGCFSAADELDDLSRNATEALALHLEGELVPEARSLSNIMADAEVAKELATGAFLVAVPFVMLTGRSQRVNVTMDAGLIDAIDTTAKDRGLTRSAYLADLARRDISG
ncbi:type II toxin-antitoxin system HicB family antitoxin [Roseibium sp.]|uniref:type II toxin-antitoxin system HicB family antitoxin n=1 Tax=Roseibium sp. TaxID=1936156 RepID=UPI003BACFC20